MRVHRTPENLDEMCQDRISCQRKSVGGWGFLTWRPGDDDDDVEGVAVATARQID